MSFKWVIGFAVLLIAANLHAPISVATKRICRSFSRGVFRHAHLPATRTKTTGAAVLIVFLIAWDVYSFGWIIQPKSEHVNEYRFSDTFDLRRRLADFVKAQPGMRALRLWKELITRKRLWSACDVGHERDDVSVLRGWIWFRPAAEHAQCAVSGKDRKSSEVPVYSDDLWNVYVNDKALPRAWIVRQVELENPQQRTLSRVLDPGFDPGRTVILDQPINHSLHSNPGEAADKLRWITYEPNGLELEVTVQEPGVLVLSEVFYPGWTAQLDNAPTKIYRADGLLRAIALESGTHRVTMRYEPRSIKWGAILSVLTFLGVGCASLLEKLRN